jgi:colanic acid/amylovoran biosynthesis protein
MKILIINQPPCNRGDESAHKALVRALIASFPSSEIRVMVPISQAESIKQYSVTSPNVEYIYEPIFPRRRGCAIIKKLGYIRGFNWIWKYYPYMVDYYNIYKWADLVLCAPGGICLGGFQDWDHLFKLELAKAYNKPIAYYGRSFGPFPEQTRDNRKFKKYSIEILKYFSFISIRDSRTEKIATDLNISYISTVDTAFLDTPSVSIPSELSSMIGLNKYVVFVPNYLLWHYAYKNKYSKETVFSFYVQIFKIYKKKFPNHKVIMLPQTFLCNTYEGDDINFFKDFEKLVNDKDLIVIPDTYSSDVQQMIISHSDCMVGARYHSVVFAINQAVPFVALSYEHKISGLLEHLNKENVMVDISSAMDNDITFQTAIRRFEACLNIAKADLNARSKAKEIASDCFNIFVKTFNNK